MDKRRNKEGRPRVFQDEGQELEQHFEDYQKQQKENPILITHFVGKDGRREYEEVPAPITYKGFQVYLWEKGIIRDLETYEKDPKFSPIITRIKAKCEVHNTKYALVGKYKENLTARIHSIKEQTETENKHTITKVDINIKRADE